MIKRSLVKKPAIELHQRLPVFTNVYRPAPSFYVSCFLGAGPFILSLLVTLTVGVWRAEDGQRMGRGREEGGQRMGRG